jgi:hypothetical protein
MPSDKMTTQVRTIRHFGVMAELMNVGKTGLVPKQQMCNARGEQFSATDVVLDGERIWVKVMELLPDGRITLSMKFVAQSSGKDLDPNNGRLGGGGGVLSCAVQWDRDQMKRKRKPEETKPLLIEDAYVNNVCKRCGTRGFRGGGGLKCR